MPHGLSFTHYNRLLAVVLVSSAIGASIPYRHHRPSTAVLPGTKGGKNGKPGKPDKGRLLCTAGKSSLEERMILISGCTSASSPRSSPATP